MIISEKLHEVLQLQLIAEKKTINLNNSANSSLTGLFETLNRNFKLAAAGMRGTHHSLFPEVDAHRGCELSVELAVGVPVQEGGLSHARVPQSQQLDQVVVVPVGHRAAACCTTRVTEQ